MSLDKVKATVLGEAKVRAEEKLGEARREAERILAAGGAEDERASAEALRDAALRLEREAIRERERIQYENRLQILSAKNKVVDEAFRRARDRLASLPESEYFRMIGAWLQALPPETGGELRVNPGEADKFSARLGEFNLGRAGSGVFSGAVADPGVQSGAIIKGSDYHIDCTVGRRLEELRETAIADLARKLFGA
ncbi:MAG: V-type ATP synthase subunit E [Planctomycetota bacterium]|jgi:V/A-type H+-transporting ATPase subunit E|nr:V-type ATP synthase subunit E [Planctomycetota bacterium]